MHAWSPGGPPTPLHEYAPPNPEHFGVEIQAFISSEPDGPADSFDFVVCTPRWFADGYDAADLRRLSETNAPLRGRTAGGQLLGRGVFRPTDERDPVVFGTGLVFMRRWDYVKLEATINDLCARIEGPDWGAIASRLGRVLPWEFDYRYDEAVNRAEPFPRPKPPADG